MPLYPEREKRYVLRGPFRATPDRTVATHLASTAMPPVIPFRILPPLLRHSRSHRECDAPGVAVPELLKTLLPRPCGNCCRHDPEVRAVHRQKKTESCPTELLPGATGCLPKDRKALPAWSPPRARPKKSFSRGRLSALSPKTPLRRFARWR